LNILFVDGHVQNYPPSASQYPSGSYVYDQAIDLSLKWDYK